MKLLPDTHLLLWITVADQPSRQLSSEASRLIEDPENDIYFSAVSVWEVATKHATGKIDFQVEPHMFRRSLMDRGYLELAITGVHAAQVGGLPHHHKDPFDRLLVAQATVEGFTLLTVDAVLAKYPGSIRQV